MNFSRAGTFAVIVALATVARGEDLSAFTSQLSELETRAKAIEPGDSVAANEVIVANNALQEKLVVHPSKGTDPWKAVAQRSLALDKSVRARLDEQLPAGAPGKHAVAAKEKLDAAEAALKSLAAGDKAAADKVLALIVDARTSLGKAVSKARLTDLWKESANRSVQLEKDVRAKLGARAPGNDGLDLDADPAGLPSTDLSYWKLFAQHYREAVADLRAGRLKDSGELAAGDLVRISKQDHKAVVRGKELVALFKKRLAEARAEVKRRADEAAAKDKLDVDEINKRLVELDAYFAKDFSAKLKPPCDAAHVRAWIANLREWSGLGAKGTAMIAKIKTDFPKYAADPAVKRLEQFFAKGLGARIAQDIEATVGRVDVGSSSTNGLLRGRIELAERYLAPDAFKNEANLADDGWMAQALEELARGIEACEALQIFQVEYGNPKREADPALAKLAEQLAQVRDAQAAAAKALYENTRLPAPSTTSAKVLEDARAAILACGTPAADILRLVVSWGPEDYSERMSRTTEIGRDMLRIESWTERGTSLQCTTAEKVKDDVRLVTYTLKIIRSGHPDSTKNQWFCSERWAGRRIKPENVAK